MRKSERTGSRHWRQVCNSCRPGETKAGGEKCRQWKMRGTCTVKMVLEGGGREEEGKQDQRVDQPPNIQEKRASGTMSQLKLLPQHNCQLVLTMLENLFSYVEKKKKSFFSQELIGNTKEQVSKIQGERIQRPRLNI